MSEEENKGTSKVKTRKMDKEELEKLKEGIEHDPRYEKRFTLTTHLYKISRYTLKDGEEAGDEG